MKQMATDSTPLLYEPFRHLGQLPLVGPLITSPSAPILSVTSNLSLLATMGLGLWNLAL